MFTLSAVDQRLCVRVLHQFNWLRRNYNDAPRWYFLTTFWPVGLHQAFKRNPYRQRQKTILCSRIHRTWLRLPTLSITTFLSADSTSLVSQMTAWPPGSPTTSQTEFSVSNLLSGPLPVSMGVPLGSILGPTLFSVYIIDVGLAAGDSLIHLYADDTILYTSGPFLNTVKPPNKLQCHTRLLPWLPTAFKCCETKSMLFNQLLPAPASPTSITTLDGSNLEYVDNYKYLGGWLDCISPSRLTLSISNPKGHLELTSYFTTKPPSLMLLNIPS